MLWNWDKLYVWCDSESNLLSYFYTKEIEQVYLYDTYKLFTSIIYMFNILYFIT